MSQPASAARKRGHEETPDELASSQASRSLGEPRVGNASCPHKPSSAENQPKKKNKHVAATPLTKHGVHEVRDGKHNTLEQKLDQVLAEQAKMSSRLLRLEEMVVGNSSQLRALQGTTWSQVKVRALHNSYS